MKKLALILAISTVLTGCLLGDDIIDEMHINISEKDDS
jgi:hypothetical protein